MRPERSCDRHLRHRGPGREAAPRKDERVPALEEHGDELALVLGQHEEAYLTHRSRWIKRVRVRFEAPGTIATAMTCRAPRSGSTPRRRAAFEVRDLLFEHLELGFASRGLHAPR